MTYEKGQKVAYKDPGSGVKGTGVIRKIAWQDGEPIDGVQTDQYDPMLHAMDPSDILGLADDD